jgi:hypothetical protein
VINFQRYSKFDPFFGLKSVVGSMLGMGMRTCSIHREISMVVVRKNHLSGSRLHASQTTDTWFALLLKHVLQKKDKHNPGKDYYWNKIHAFTRWKPGGKTDILIFNARDTFKTRFPIPILNELDQRSLQDPYWIHVYILEEFVQLQDAAVWAIRDKVRETELVSLNDFQDRSLPADKSQVAHTFL